METNETESNSQAGMWTVYCPRCGRKFDSHGSVTVTPSILVTGGAEERVCHSFLTNGVWHFLPDSTHAYAGRQASMTPWPEGWSW